MDLVLKGRGVRITEAFRETAAHKVAKLPKLDPNADRIEIEVIAERLNHGPATRVEGSLHTPRKVFRAHADSRDMQEAFDMMVDRLGRQARDHRDKKRRSVIRGANRVKSARVQAGETRSSED
jgi:ribosomal subunit interface protein